jgi:hypothetical protein
MGEREGKEKGKRVVMDRTITGRKTEERKEGR